MALITKNKAYSEQAEIKQFLIFFLFGGKIPTSTSSNAIQTTNHLDNVQLV